MKPPAKVRLADLREGEQAVILELDSSGWELDRLRLLDLGLTPGVEIAAELTGTFGDPRAYRVRGALIALRREQTRKIWVRRL